MFSTIMDRLTIPDCFLSDLPQFSPKSASKVDRHRLVVWDVISQLVDDTKDLAFKTTFLEPTKMCFRRHEEFAREDQVEVHGANAYLAVLASTIGVQLNRRPHLSDFVVGCVDFLKAFDETPAAWKPEHFGLDWESRRELRDSAQTQRQLEPDGTPTQVGFFEFFGLIGSIFGFSGFIFSGATVQEVANAAVDPDGDKELKEHMAKYLEAFTYWFSEDFLMPRMINRLTGEGGCLEALQGVMEDLVEKEPAWKSEEDDEDDVRFWLWDMDQLPAVLRKHRALRLLRHAGVMKAEVHFLASDSKSKLTRASSSNGGSLRQWRRSSALGV